MSDKIVSIKWVLVDLIYDFCGAADVYRDYSSRDYFDPHEDMESLSAIRVCQTSAIIGLSRLWELLNGYGKEIREVPEPLRKKLIELKEEIEHRKVYQFRNKYVGHVFDNETKAPIKLEDGYPRLIKIIGGDWDTFYNWIFPGPDKDYSTSVVGVVTEFRDYCNEIVGELGERP